MQGLQQELWEKWEASSRALQEFEGRLDEKINCLLHPVMFSAPLYYTSGVPVVAEDTAGNLPRWGSVVDQGTIGFPSGIPGGETRALAGQQGGLSLEGSSINTPSNVPNTPDTPKESQVRVQQWYGEQELPKSHCQGLEGAQQPPRPQPQEGLGQASQPLKEAEAGNEQATSAQQDFKTRDSAPQVTTNQ